MPKIIDEEAVFKAVIALLVVRGYERTTTSDMAAAANMHEATLFRKYGSKVGLIERAIAHQLSETPMGQVRYSDDLRADLTLILEAYLATVAEHGQTSLAGEAGQTAVLEQHQTHLPKSRRRLNPAHNAEKSGANQLRNRGLKTECRGGVGITTRPPARPDW